MQEEENASFLSHFFQKSTSFLWVKMYGLFSWPHHMIIFQIHIHLGIEASYIAHLLFINHKAPEDSHAILWWPQPINIFILTSNTQSHFFSIDCCNNKALLLTLFLDLVVKAHFWSINQLHCVDPAVYPFHPSLHSTCPNIDAQAVDCNVSSFCTPAP